MFEVTDRLIWIYILVAYDKLVWQVSRYEHNRNTFILAGGKQTDKLLL